MANGKAPKKEAKKIETPTSKRTVRGVSAAADDYDKTVGTMADYMSKRPKIKHTTKAGSREFTMNTGEDHYKNTGTVSVTSGTESRTLSGKDADDFMKSAYTSLAKKREKDYAAMTRNMGRGLVSMSRMLKSEEPSNVLAKKEQKKP